MTRGTIQLGTTVAIFGAWSALALPAAQAAPPDRMQGLRFELVDLGTLGGAESKALAMDDTGLVVGWAHTADGLTHAFLWEEGVMSDLGTLGGDWSEATGVNSWGGIIGISATLAGEAHPFFYSGGQLVDLNNIIQWQPETQRVSIQPTRVLTDVKAINENGWIVGSGYVAGDENLHGYVLIPGTGRDVMTFAAFDLGTLPGTLGCLPYCINDQNVVVGVSGNLAFQWEYGMMSALDQFTRTVLFESRATGISNRGLVVGWYAESAPEPHEACLWQGGSHVPLGAGGGFYHEATGVNSLGQIVGWNWLANGPAAVMWEGRTLTDLNDVTAIPLRQPEGQTLFVWAHLVSAAAVDENGWIVGFGHSPSGQHRAFLLKPLQVAYEP
jgi:probable HAF family extracellular repeat protein